MNDINQAVSQLRVRQLAMESEHAAMDLLLKEVLRFRKALQYYADPKNYLDGSPMLEDFALADDGRTAQVALRLVDYRGEPLIVLPEGAVHETGETGEAAND